MTQALCTGGFFHALNHGRVKLHGIKARQHAPPALHAFFGCHLLGKRPQLSLCCLQHGAVGIAQINREQGFVGDHVDQIRRQRDGADRCNLVAAITTRQFACESCHARCHIAGIVAHMHGRGACVVGHTMQREFGPGNSLHTFDDPDLQALAIQHRTLFNVQFNKTVDPVVAHCCSTGVTDAAQLIAHGGTVNTLCGQGCGEWQITLKHQTTHHVGGESRALLICEKRHRNRSLGSHFGVAQSGDHLQSGKHPVVAVIESAGAHRVDVRAGHHGSCVFEPRVQRDHIANGIHRDGHAQLPHACHGPVAALLVSIGKRQAADTPTRQSANGTKFLQRCQQTRTVNDGLTHASALA